MPVSNPIPLCESRLSHPISFHLADTRSRDFGVRRQLKLSFESDWSANTLVFDALFSLRFHTQKARAKQLRSLASLPPLQINLSPTFLHLSSSSNNIIDKLHQLHNNNNPFSSIHQPQSFTMARTKQTARKSLSSPTSSQHFSSSRRLSVANLDCDRGCRLTFSLNFDASLTKT